MRAPFRSCTTLAPASVKSCSRPCPAATTTTLRPSAARISRAEACPTAAILYEDVPTEDWLAEYAGEPQPKLSVAGVDIGGLDPCFDAPLDRAQTARMLTPGAAPVTGYVEAVSFS